MFKTLRLLKRYSSAKNIEREWKEELIAKFGRKVKSTIMVQQ